SVLLCSSGGTVASRQDAVAGVQPVSPVIADFNLDGRLDVAVANAGAGSFTPSVTILPGLGDGNLGDPLRTPIPGLGFPVSLAGGDWNWDGRMDAAVTDLFNANVRTFRGRGDGTFDPPSTLRFHGGTGFPDDC